NIFARSSPQPDRHGSPRVAPPASAINQVYATDGFEVYNNTFDGKGFATSAIELARGTFMPSLRNNLFMNFTTARIVGPGWNEKTAAPPPPRLGYADHNLFHNPQARGVVNYAVSVKGKAERKDAGFALNDVPRGGKVNAQVDPKLTGPIPETFPF